MLHLSAIGRGSAALVTKPLFGTKYKIGTEGTYWLRILHVSRTSSLFWAPATAERLWRRICH